MSRVSPSIHQGIAFVSLSELPYEQNSRLSSWVSSGRLMTMSMEGEEKSDCLLYADYLHWFDHYFQTSRVEFDF